MADSLTPEQRHRNMAAIHSTSTKPELKVRHALWQLGFRYRVNDKRLPGSPDIVLAKYRTVIFVHGCFWHGHKDCKSYAVPKTNTEFWSAKVAKNKKHDQEAWRQLEAKGWFVIIVWECQLKNAKLIETIGSLAKEIQRNGEIVRSAKDDRRKKRDSYLQERENQKEKRALLLSEIKNIIE